MNLIQGVISAAGCADIHGVVFAHSAPPLQARIYDVDESQLIPGEISAIEYTAYVIDQHDKTSRSEIAGHVDVSLDPDNVLFTTLQDWGYDSDGFNFSHVLDLDLGNVFSTPDRDYLIEYTFTRYNSSSSSGEDGGGITASKYLVSRFRLKCI